MQYLRIADLDLSVEGADFDYVKSLLKKYNIDKPTDVDANVTFNLNEDIDIGKLEHFASRDGRYYYNFNDTYGFYDYIDEVEKYVTLMECNKDRSKIKYNYSDLSEIFGIPSDVATFNVLGNLFGQIILNHNGVVIHASTIVYKGEAVTFTAASGVGKSTHTALWKKYYPDVININDDSPALRLIDGNFVAYGTPWSGKSSINENMSAPLKAMVFIERSDVCSITEISSDEAFLRMIRENAISPFKHQSDLLMDIMNSLFSKVPSYLLKCDMSKNAVDTVKNKLF